jgi:hypothetical protein
VEKHSSEGWRVGIGGESLFLLDLAGQLLKIRPAESDARTLTDVEKAYIYITGNEQTQDFASTLALVLCPQLLFVFILLLREGLANLLKLASNSQSSYFISQVARITGLYHGAL